MGSCMKQVSTWLQWDQTTGWAGNTILLICVPPAASPAQIFSAWGQWLPANVTLMAVELPGRGRRTAETPPNRLQDMAVGIAGAVEEDARQQDVVLYGHSQGSWLAFEVCRELERRGKGSAARLIVSGMRPPHLAGPENDPDAMTPTITGLGSEEFWEAFERRYGLSQEMRASEVKRAIEPVLRRDLKLGEDYRPDEQEPRVACPLLVIHPAGDTRCLEDDAWRWRECQDGSDFHLASVRPRCANSHRCVMDDPECIARRVASALQPSGD